MRAIILAAGVGSRLRPITDKKPKTMVEVNGKPMISYIVDAIASAGVNEIVVCAGYRAEQLESYLSKNYSDKLKIRIVNNSAYETTNNMYSLYLARDFLSEDVLLMNADLVFDKEVVRELVEEVGSVVAVDKGLFQDESMKLVVDQDGYIQNISKKIEPEKSYGCSIDVYKFDKQSTKVLKQEIVKIIEEEEDLNQWTEVLLDKVFSEKLVYAKPLDIKGKKWYEIDNYEDLLRAEILFNEKLKLINKKKAFILDKDGTLTIGKTAIDGASSFLSVLDNANMNWVVGSNNSSKTSKAHSQGLKTVFPEFENISVVSSLDVAVDYFKQKEIKKIYWVANKEVSNELSKQFTLDQKNPECILLTYDDEIDYQKIQKLVELIRKGIPYYATHIDVVCPTENGDIPDIGSFIELIYKSTKVRPLKNFGKPTKDYLNYVLDYLNATAGEAVLIGDRLYTDILACANEDITSVLVLSGETTRSTYEESDVRADVVLPSIKELVNYIK